MTPKQRKQYKAYMKTSMYFVTVIEPKLKNGNIYYGGKRPTSSRCWGWYRKLKDAIIAVVENHTDIHEDSYDYAVIEKVPEGVIPMSEDIKWFVWEGDPDKGKYVECPKPKWAEITCNWSIG